MEGAHVRRRSLKDRRLESLMVLGRIAEGFDLEPGFLRRTRKRPFPTSARRSLAHSVSTQSAVLWLEAWSAFCRDLTAFVPRSQLFTDFADCNGSGGTGAGWPGFTLDLALSFRVPEPKFECASGLRTGRSS